MVRFTLGSRVAYVVAVSVTLAVWLAGAASDPALAASGWSIQPTPTLAAGGVLSGVSCTASTDCTAVGSSGGATLAEHWNGTKWSTQTTQNPPGATSSVLSGVSCTSATTTTCTAVGSYVNSSGVQQTLAEGWSSTGGWVIQATPSQGSSVLSGVSCTSATACTAVGQTNNGRRQALAEQWNGTTSTWVIEPTPSPTQYRFLTSFLLSGVSCALNECTAVGQSTGFVCNGSPSCGNCFQPPGCTSRQETLAERWDGSTWRIQATPYQPALFGVSCATLTACTAVGHYPDGTIAESWDGSRWSVDATSENLTNNNGILSGVSCTKANACVAVGQAKGMTFAEISNPDWLFQPTPNPSGATGSQLTGVSCATSAACTAVGYYTNSAGTDLTLAESYAG
jgi:hypothetical protein